MTARRRPRHVAGAVAALALLGVTACQTGTDLEPTTEEPGFQSRLPDADNVDEQLDDEEDDD